jgi:hypothetical protein
VPVVADCSFTCPPRLGASSLQKANVPGNVDWQAGAVERMAESGSSQAESSRFCDAVPPLALACSRLESNPLFDLARQVCGDWERSNVDGH